MLGSLHNYVLSDAHELEVDSSYSRAMILTNFSVKSTL